MVDTQQFPNSYKQPQEYDTVLAAEYTPGDGVLVVQGCPPGVAVTGPVFQCKVGSTLYRVTALGTGSVHWAVPAGPVENTIDAVHIVGTGVVLELTHEAVETIRGATFLTAVDESGNGFPNSRRPRVTDNSDVQLTGLADGDVLEWDAGTSKWVNGVGGGGGSGSLAGDSDVELTSPSDGQILSFDGGISKWINSDPNTLGAGLEVVITPTPIVRSGELIVSGGLSPDIVVVAGGATPPDFLTTEDGTDFVYDDVVFPPEPVTTPDNHQWIYG